MSNPQNTAPFRLLLGEQIAALWQWIEPDPTRPRIIYAQDGWLLGEKESQKTR